MTGGGGYLLQLDWIEKKGAILSKHWNYGYRYEYPDSDKATVKQQNYIENLVYQTEEAIKSQNVSEIMSLIDIQSMINYQIMTELSLNADGYTLSTFMYKHSDEIDGRFKFSLWDYDLAYGNCARKGCSDIDSKLYQLCLESNSWPFANWWSEMMKDSIYKERFRQSWMSYRKNLLSDEHISHTTDSLVNVLTIGGAQLRNSTAWPKIWGKDMSGPKRQNLQKYISTSYTDELTYLKIWVERRLKWMDEQLILGL